ncbi:diguanylate cyclase [Acanthopleuribacter pedis]|uniref:diguanylate cyclase n=1 Tax=Acanthopleuribacter pedis TaxID=442870 RepID=A0A8J7QRA1_9BACT|nr:diguanylate cyclase [Acanthopleuribacter pedis]MBO1322765.1 diguanylate cyclase [Acanthopleuribacter pedis]
MPAKHPDILIVDDQVANLKLLRAALRDRYTVRGVTSGDDALKLLEGDLPDLVLLDIEMPGIDGYEVCRHIKAKERTQHLPVMFLTGKNNSGDEEKGLACGAVDYIGKPFQLPIVKARIHTQLSLKFSRDRLLALSTHDALTGIANRRQFDISLGLEWRRALRAETSLCIIIGDIDYFKKYNDGYGHTAGDETLKRVAEILSGSIHRAGEILARYGGEEFVVILPNADIESGRKVAESMCRDVAAAALSHRFSPLKQVTMSFGVAASVPMDAQSPEYLTSSADTALYQAKGGGRNQVHVYTGPISRLKSPHEVALLEPAPVTLSEDQWQILADAVARRCMDEPVLSMLRRLV